MQLAQSHVNQRNGMSTEIITKGNYRASLNAKVPGQGPFKAGLRDSWRGCCGWSVLGRDFWTSEVDIHDGKSFSQYD